MFFVKWVGSSKVKIKMVSQNRHIRIDKVDDYFRNSQVWTGNNWTTLDTDVFDSMTDLAI